MFQKSPVQTAFWTFIESSRYITGLVIYWMVFQSGLFIFSLRYFKRIFSAKTQVFKPNIFGGTPTFQKFYFQRRIEFSILFHRSKPPDFEINGSYCTIVSYKTWVSLILLQCRCLRPFQSFIHSR